MSAVTDFFHNLPSFNDSYAKSLLQSNIPGDTGPRSAFDWNAFASATPGSFGLSNNLLGFGNDASAATANDSVLPFSSVSSFQPLMASSNSNALTDTNSWLTNNENSLFDNSNLTQVADASGGGSPYDLAPTFGDAVKGTPLSGFSNTASAGAWWNTAVTIALNFLERFGLIILGVVLIAGAAWALSKERGAASATS